MAVGINLDGERDVLGLWVGTGGEGATWWRTVLTELKNRGADVCIVCCDGLEGLPPRLMTPGRKPKSNMCCSFSAAGLRFASKKYWAQITKALRAVYAAPTIQAAETRFAEFETKWGTKYPAIVKLWRSAWAEFIPFLQYPAPIRKVIYRESDRIAQSKIPASHPPRWPFPQRSSSTQSSLPRHPQQTSQPPPHHRKTHGWKEVINTLAEEYGERITANHTN